MIRSRRDAMRSGAALSALAAAGLLSPAQLRAMPARSAFDARSLADALAAIGGTPADSKALLIDVPEVAEDGAIVPVSVISKLPNTEEIHVLVEKNRWPLAASFKLGRHTEPRIEARFKMAESTKVMIVVKADGRLYSAVRETRVTIGGCGG